VSCALESQKVLRRKKAHHFSATSVSQLQIRSMILTSFWLALSPFINYFASLPSPRGAFITATVATFICNCWPSQSRII
jgi:hypothetical protein